MPLDATNETEATEAQAAEAPAEAPAEEGAPAEEPASEEEAPPEEEGGRRRRLLSVGGRRPARRTRLEDEPVGVLSEEYLMVKIPPDAAPGEMFQALSPVTGRCGAARERQGGWGWGFDAWPREALSAQCPEGRTPAARALRRGGPYVIRVGHTHTHTRAGPTPSRCPP